MTEAELSHADVTARLAAATPETPADLSHLRLNGLDLTGLDEAALARTRSLARAFRR